MANGWDKANILFFTACAVTLGILFAILILTAVHSGGPSDPNEGFQSWTQQVDLGRGQGLSCAFFRYEDSEDSLRMWCLED